MNGKNSDLMVQHFGLASTISQLGPFIIPFLKHHTPSLTYSEQRQVILCQFAPWLGVYNRHYKHYVSLYQWLSLGGLVDKALLQDA